MFFKIAEAIFGLQGSVDRVCSRLENIDGAMRGPSEDSPIGDRVSSIEGQLAALRGDIQAATVKAEATKAAARASEDRARGHLQRAQKLAEFAEGLNSGEERDPFEEAEREHERELRAIDDVTSEGVQPVLSHMDARSQALAEIKAAKRGVV